MEPNDDHDGTQVGVEISDFVFTIQISIDAMYRRFTGEPDAITALTQRLLRVRIGGPTNKLIAQCPCG